MEAEIFIQYITYSLIVIGILSFLTSVIIQVIKELPSLQKIHTNTVTFIIAEILCLLTIIALCVYLNITITWYYIIGTVIAAFIVYLVATGGSEKVSEMWKKTNYKK